jgi:hypothetical protein
MGSGWGYRANGLSSVYTPTKIPEITRGPFFRLSYPSAVMNEQFIRHANTG